MLTGYDIDGVLTRPGVMTRDEFDQEMKNAVVISGRTFAEYDDTAKKVAMLCPVYIRGAGTYGDRDHAGRFKAQMIAHLGVKRFYEDDPLQAAIITALAPDCDVVVVQ